jgi:hypothetical protein
MKIQLTFKDPDYSTDPGVQSTTRVDRAFINSFIEYDEYITVEFDTEQKTTRVVPVKE